MFLMYLLWRAFLFAIAVLCIVAFLKVALVIFACAAFMWVTLKLADRHETRPRKNPYRKTMSSR